MNDMEIRATKIGPFIRGTIRETPPKSPGQGLLVWILTVIALGFASPMLGVILILLTAMYLAVRTAPADRTDERNDR